MTAAIAALFRRPIKGLTPEKVKLAGLQPGKAVPNDRLYALEDGPCGFDPAQPAFNPKQRFAGLAKIAEAAPTRTRLDEATGLLHAEAEGRPPFVGKLPEPAGRAAFAKWAGELPGEAAEGPLRLVDGEGHRFLDHPSGHVSIINLESLRALEQRLGRSLDPLRFRANAGRNPARRRRLRPEAGAGDFTAARFGSSPMTQQGSPMLTVRRFDPHNDSGAVSALDTSFTTTAVYEVTADDSGLTLSLSQLDAPLTKRFPLDDLDARDRPWSDAWVAEADSALAGFAATSFETWNRRLVLWHLYVAPKLRRRGVAARLLVEVERHAQAVGARHVWLETSSLNVPGASAYRRLGFELTGIDRTLYDATPAEGEIALFFSKPAPVASPV